jgi:hypothetical protein
MDRCSDFWNVLAQLHAEIEDTNFDLASARRLLPEIKSPVLVVGAGQGLIVEELRKHGCECDGVDLSSEMIRQAKLRRGITLVRADAKALPFPAGSYETIIYATGVVDFTADEDDTHNSVLAMSLMLLVPLLVLLTTPFIRPFRWSRLLWTYLVPVVPMVSLFDGLVSSLRTYSVWELRELTEELDAKDYQCEVGEVKGTAGPIPVTYLLRVPIDRAI